MTIERRMTQIGNKMLTTGMTLREYYIGNFPKMEMVQDILRQLAEWEERNLSEVPELKRTEFNGIKIHVGNPIPPDQPDWDIAPEWAEYLGIDNKGNGTWYTKDLAIIGDDWLPMGQTAPAGKFPHLVNDYGWNNLILRPEKKAHEVEVPDWSTAPEWAYWWAVDADGNAYWYKCEPYPSDNKWVCIPVGHEVSIFGANSHPDLAPNWRETLRKRP